MPWRWRPRESPSMTFISMERSWGRSGAEHGFDAEVSEIVEINNENSRDNNDATR